MQSKIAKVKPLLTVIEPYSYLVNLAVTIKSRLNFKAAAVSFENL